MTKDEFLIWEAE